MCTQYVRSMRKQTVKNMYKFRDAGIQRNCNQCGLVIDTRKCKVNPISSPLTAKRVNSSSSVPGAPEGLDEETKKCLQMDVDTVGRNLALLKIGTVTGEAFKDLASKYCPVFRFDTAEMYFPESFNTYVQNASLVNAKFIIPEFAIEPRSDYIVKSKYAFDATSPVYTHIRHLKIKNHDMLAISYFLFYAYNGSSSVTMLPDILSRVMKVGEHEADLEKVVVYVDHKSGKVERIYFGRHSLTDGELRENDHIDRIRFYTPFGEQATQRPVVYVAKNSHGMYPHPGKNYLKGYMTYDTFDGKGRTFSGQVVSISDGLKGSENASDDAQMMVNFSGKLGSTGVDNIVANIMNYIKYEGEVLYEKYI